jgi:hypothetical protein
VKRIRKIESPPGGVMTEEAGAVTGLLTLRLRGRRDRQVYVDVAYEGSDEFYEVTGSPLAPRAHLSDEIAGHLQADPGVDEHGNAEAVDVADMPVPELPPKLVARAQAAHPHVGRTKRDSWRSRLARWLYRRA